MSDCKHQRPAFLFLAFLFFYLGSLEVLADDHVSLAMKKEIYPDGSYALIETRDGVATGTTKEFDKDDTLLAEYEVLDGELNGTFLTFNSDGTLKSSEKYAEGQRHGLAKIYDERGYLQQVQRYEDGEFKGLVPIHEAFEVLDDLSRSEVKHCVTEDIDLKFRSILREYWLFKNEESEKAEWYVFNPDTDNLAFDDPSIDVNNYAYRYDSRLVSPNGRAVFMAHRTAIDGAMPEVIGNEFVGYVCIKASSQAGCATRSSLMVYGREIRDIIEEEGDISVLPWIEKAYKLPFRHYQMKPDGNLLSAQQTIYVLTASITFNSDGRRDTFLEYQYKADPRHVGVSAELNCTRSTLAKMKAALQSDSNED